MSVEGWNTALVLGGIRSGKSEFAEALLADAPVVRYVATGAPAGDDEPEWEARLAEHRARRPGGWTTEEIGGDAGRLAAVIGEAKPDEALIVDDLGGWAAGLLARGRGGDEASQLPVSAEVEQLVAVVRDGNARLVLVSPEVGLSVVPATPVGRAFADLLGAVNRQVADACDAVVLIVAGQPSWLKGGPTVRPTPEPATAATAEDRPAPAEADAPAGPAWQPAEAEVITPAAAAVAPGAAATADRADEADAGALSAPTMVLPTVRTADDIRPGMDLPMPYEEAIEAAKERIARLDVPGTGLGVLDRAVSFAAGTQARAIPEPWRAVRVLLLRGDHEGGASAGVPDGESARRVAEARSGGGPLASLAAACGASLQVVDAPTSAPMEDGPALTAETVDAALEFGWRLAEQAGDEGSDLIVLAACGAGTDTAGAAVLAAVSGAEVPAVLGRVVAPDGLLDDNAWMVRCAAARDALHRVRSGPRGPRDVLAELAGGDVAVAVGLLLGAAARRIPVLIDGPVGIAAGLISRDIGGQARHWCLLPDHGRHPGVRLGADVLGLDPYADLRLDLGEGARSLALLPLLNAAIALAGSLPVRPAGTAPEDAPAEARTEAPRQEDHAEPGA